MTQTIQDEKLKTISYTSINELLRKFTFNEQQRKSFILRDTSLFERIWSLYEVKFESS